ILVMFTLPKFTTTQIDGINIGLMIISLILAYILPFELLLVSYAVLGTLHYLTEISWLHQKKYFIPIREEKNKWLFPVIAVILTGLLSLDNVLDLFQIKFVLPKFLRGTNIIFFLFGTAFIAVVFKKQYIRIIAILALALLSMFFNLEQSCITCTDQAQKTIELCDQTNSKIVTAF